jgi:cysteinyl-tRNA synthetase
MSAKRSQPDWSPPPDAPKTAKNKLFLYNSLTRSKCEFRAIDERRITWYNCGPTVYDSAHMGHARSYISFDIIRRVLQKYFRFDVFFVQNVTDIDDKIIQRARQRYLFGQYCQSIGDQNRDQLVADVRQAIGEVETKMATEADVNKKQMWTKLIASTNDNLEDKNLNVKTLL